MSASLAPSPATVPTAATRRVLGHHAGFWVTAAAFLVVMAYSTVPTPLWALYQARDGFSTFAVTLAFAAYAVGVVASLFLAGHLGDTHGRRTVLLPAIALEAVSAVVFLAWPELPGLVVARVVSGLGIGLLAATITAHLLDLHATARPDAGHHRAQLVAGAANLGGFGLGALVSGLLAAWVGAPLVTPYVVFLVLLVLAFAGVALVPETATPPAVRPPYRPQRVRVPRAARGRFLLAGGTAFAAFSVLGLFTALAPTFVAGGLGITSRAVAGAVVFVAFAAAVLAQALARRSGPRPQLVAGAALMVVGIAGLVTVVTAGGGLLVFFVAGAASGAGAGLLFKAALAVAGALADAAVRGEVLAGVFLAGYVGLTVPVVGLGAATLTVSLATALAGFGGVIVVVTLATAVPLQAALARRPA